MSLQGRLVETLGQLPTFCQDCHYSAYAFIGQQLCRTMATNRHRHESRDAADSQAPGKEEYKTRSIEGVPGGHEAQASSQIRIDEKGKPLRALQAACAGLAAIAAIAVTALPASAATVDTPHTARAVVVVTDKAQPSTYSTKDGTVIALGPGWTVVAHAKIPNVRPVVVTANTSPATAARDLAKGAGINCGIVTCTLYIYRGTTKTIDRYVARYAGASASAIAGAFAVACAPLGGIGAAVCAAVGATYGGYAIDQFNYAAQHNECIAAKYLPGALLPIDIYPDHDGYCHN